jgi:hypothetical protein
MNLGAREIEFLSANASAAMITVGADGFAKPVRVAVRVVDGKLHSSGTRERARTRRLRRDPRCTLYVHDDGWSYLSLETIVTILDGPEAASRNLALFRAMQGKPEGPVTWNGTDLEEEAFLAAMVDDHRLIYEFDVQRVHGMY